MKQTISLSGSRGQRHIMAAMVGEDWRVEDGNRVRRRKAEDPGKKGWELDLGWRHR